MVLGFSMYLKDLFIEGLLIWAAKIRGFFRKIFLFGIEDIIINYNN